MLMIVGEVIYKNDFFIALNKCFKEVDLSFRPRHKDQGNTFKTTLRQPSQGGLVSTVLPGSDKDQLVLLPLHLQQVVPHPYKDGKRLESLIVV